MSIPGAASPLFLGAAVAEEAAYQIDRSLRFNSADSAYLNRTPSSAGNRKTWTWSGWVKRSKLGAQQALFNAGVSSGQQISGIAFSSSGSVYDKLELWTGVQGVSTEHWCQSEAFFRDPSAWYHIVVAVDTTQSTAANRVKIYVNNSTLALAAYASYSTYPSQNYAYGFNNTVAHQIGKDTIGTPAQFDGYLADVHFIDGQALAPTDFGEYDSDNNWNPKEYSGTYGTNGFHLDFADYSDLGDDNSGNGNDWTPNNLVGLDVKTETTNAFSGSGTTHGSVENLLNNNTTNGYGVQNGTLTYTPASAITVSSQIVFHYSTDQSNTRFRVNSGSWITLPDPSGVGTYTHSFSGSLTKIEWNAPSSGELVSVHRLQIDSQILVNPTIAAGNDSLIDTPTNYEADSGNNGGNYCTWNPLAREASRFTFANGNLNVSGNAQNYGISGTLFVGGSGKYYFELTSNSSVTYPVLGIVSAEAVSNDMVDGSIANGLELGGPVYGFMPGYGPRILTQTTTTTWSGVSQSTPTSGDVYGVAVDFDNGAIYFSKNGTFLNSGDPTSGSTKTGAAFTSISAGDYTVLLHDLGSSDNIDFDLNAGQRSFSYTPPTNYKSLCTQNLPDPTIADGSTAFDTKLYTGTGSTQSITGLNFSPDFVWIKNRNANGSHDLYDIVRGADTVMNSDATFGDYSGSGRLTSFNSDGFTLGSQSAVNINGGPFVSWNWDGGTSTASNTDGSITSNVRASQANGFSIVGYTGTGANASVGHGLNAAPEFLIIKNRTDSENWFVWHADFSIPTRNGFYLDLTANVQNFGVTSFNDTVPSSSVITLGTNNILNGSGDNYIAYCFNSVSQYSSFGSYTGNGSTDGPFVYTGFRPAFLLFKNTAGTENWRIMDTARNTFNVVDNILYPNLSNAEGSSAVGLDILSNGFKIRESGSELNDSGDEIIYAAFAEHPFKTARAR